MTKLEEVARAICEADNHAWPEDDYNGRFQRMAFIRQARAAVIAMREPTEGMRRAGIFATATRTVDATPDERAVWKAMIDEALK